MKINPNNINHNEYFSYCNIVSSDYKNYQLQDYLRSVLPIDKKARIIDIGCGLGQTLIALKKLGYNNVRGIDISTYAVEQCKAKGLDVTLSPNIISFCRKRKKKYDFIVMSHVLEHVAKNEIIDTLKVIRSKILSDDGLLCIMVPNAQSNTGCYWAYEDFTHSLLFTSGSLFYVLKSAGFSNIKFLDIDGLQGHDFFRKMVKSVLLKYYKIKSNFWNKVTISSYHVQSPQIFTFEIKAIAKK